ncbi:MAG: RnfABCDGE type electron transport complex subunit C [Brevinema sp.]
MKAQGIVVRAEGRCRGLSIKSIPMQSQYFLPIGAEGLLIQKGQEVRIGQVITPDIGTNVLNHSPIDGIFEEVQSFHGQDYAVIRAHAQQNWPEYPNQDPFIKTPDELIEDVRKAGIVGMGGAGFPTHLKLKTAKNKVHTILINGVECEPFLASDVALMLEHASQIVQGARLIRYIVGAKYITIAIHKNPELRAHLETYIDETIQVIETESIYPSGFEKFLVKQMTEQEINYKQFTIDAGIITQNVATTFAIYEALVKNKPLFERTLTVDGALANEYGNFRVLIGTPISAFMRPFADFNACVGINGGPMMGRSLQTAQSTMKNMNGVLIFEGEIDEPETECISCSACVTHCPMRLEPFRLIDMLRHEESDLAIEDGVLECIGCNACSYVCPSYIPLGSTIFQGKRTLMTQKK